MKRLKKSKLLDPALEVEDAVQRFSAHWAQLPGDEAQLAEKMTQLTAYAGGRKATAASMGMSENTLDNYRSGRTQPKFLEVLKLAASARHDIRYLLAGSSYYDAMLPAPIEVEYHAHADDSEMDAGEPSPVETMPADMIPVLGVAEGSLGGSFAFTGQALSWVRRLPSLAHLPGVYAMKVAGLSMAPRYQPGDVVVVDPRRACKAGDIIVIHTRNHAADKTVVWLKQLVDETEDLLIVRQLSDGARHDWSKSTVQSVHRVLTGNELLGL
jgi:phage repressor protein C with HTH and peptisase S24 domain